MTAEPSFALRRRPTPGALYVAGVAAFAIAALLVVAAGGMTPPALAVIGVPLGPLGVVAAVAALPELTAPPSPAVALLVLASAMAIAVVNVLVAALVSRAATGRPLLRR
ncbi:hypothetical protein [Amnibacterium kyonggiense]